MYQAYAKGWFEADTLPELAKEIVTHCHGKEDFCPMVTILTDEDCTDIVSTAFEAMLLKEWEEQVGELSAVISKASWKKGA